MFNCGVENPGRQQPTINNTNTGGSEHSALRAGWYILRCGGGLEFQARDALSDSGWATFLPIERKWRPALLRKAATECRYPRFPGYLFLHVDGQRWPQWREWPLANLIRGVLSMQDRPVPLAPGEIERLRAEDGAAVASGVPSLHRAFAAGQAVRIVRGAFRDFTARIEVIDDSGARIEVQIFGRPTAVTLPLTWLKAA
jgi:transcription antitermination factor NusG